METFDPNRERWLRRQLGQGMFSDEIAVGLP